MKYLILVLALLVAHTALTVHAVSHQVMDSVQCQICIGEHQQSSADTVHISDWAVVHGLQAPTAAIHSVFVSNPIQDLYSPRAPPVIY